VLRTAATVGALALTYAAYTDAQTPLNLDLTQVSARRDSFRILFEGDTIGYAVGALLTENDSLVYWERTAIPMMAMTQETSIGLDPHTFTHRYVQIAGDYGGRAVDTHLVYQDGRVVGRAQDLAPTNEIKTVIVDTALAGGTVDLNLLQPMLPLMNLAPGASFALSVFDATEPGAHTVTLDVVGTELVKVPAGTFEAFRILFNGFEESAVYFVSTEPPRRVIKTELMSQPISFELVQMR
jgi:hypothetical protein